MNKPRVRCSSLDRLLNCPGSRTLEAIVDPREGDDGMEGSAIHWEIAWRAVRELGAAQPEGGIVLPKDILPGYRVPAYSAWIIDWCFRILQESIPATWALEVENELEWEFDKWILTGHEDIAATSPCGRFGKDKDWKTGRIPVLPAEFNEQVGGYAALRHLNYGLDELELEICQPWNSEEDGFARQSSVTLGRDRLEANYRTLDERVCEALGRPMELDTGPSQCKYCVGLSCPALCRDLKSMKMTLTRELLATIRAQPESGRLVDLVAMARTLTKPIEDAEEMLKERLETRLILTGDSGVTARLKESSGGFQVVDPLGMFEWLSDQMKPEQLAPALGYPDGRIKDALAKALNIPATGKAAITAKTVFEGGAAPFIEAKTKRMLILQ